MTHIAASQQALAMLQQRMDSLERSVALARRQSGEVAYWQRRFNAIDVRTSLRAAVAEALVIDNPVPHLVVEPLLPADVYDLIVDNLPEPSAFGTERGGRLSLGPWGFDTVSPLTRLAYEFVDSDIAQTIAETAVPRLRPVLRRHYADLFDSDKAEQVAALPHSARGGHFTLRQQGHVDRPYVPPKDCSVTVLLGFAPRGSAARVCLALQAIDGHFARVRIGVSYPEEHGCTCRPIAQLPLGANSAVILVNTGYAQSLEPLPLGTEGALGYAFSCQVGPDRPRLIDVAATLPAAAQQAWLGLLTENLR